jgi:hypothetical protein
VEQAGSGQQNNLNFIISATRFHHLIKCIFGINHFGGGQMKKILALLAITSVMVGFVSCGEEKSVTQKSVLPKTDSIETETSTNKETDWNFYNAQKDNRLKQAENLKTFALEEKLKKDQEKNEKTKHFNTCSEDWNYIRKPGIKFSYKASRIKNMNQETLDSYKPQEEEFNLTNESNELQIESLENKIPEELFVLDSNTNDVFDFCNSYNSYILDINYGRGSLGSISIKDTRINESNFIRYKNGFNEYTLQESSFAKDNYVYIIDSETELGEAWGAPDGKSNVVKVDYIHKKCEWAYSEECCPSNLRILDKHLFYMLGSLMVIRDESSGNLVMELNLTSTFPELIKTYNKLSEHGNVTDFFIKFNCQIKKDNLLLFIQSCDIDSYNSYFLCINLLDGKTTYTKKLPGKSDIHYCGYAEEKLIYFDKANSSIILCGIDGSFEQHNVSEKLFRVEKIGNNVVYNTYNGMFIGESFDDSLRINFNDMWFEEEFDGNIIVSTYKYADGKAIRGSALVDPNSKVVLWSIENGQISSSLCNNSCFFVSGNPIQIVDKETGEIKKTTLNLDNLSHLKYIDGKLYALKRNTCGGNFSIIPEFSIFRITDKQYGSFIKASNYSFVWNKKDDPVKYLKLTNLSDKDLKLEFEIDSLRDFQIQNKDFILKAKTKEKISIICKNSDDFGSYCTLKIKGASNNIEILLLSMPCPQGDI